MCTYMTCEFNVTVYSLCHYICKFDQYMTSISIIFNILDEVVIINCCNLQSNSDEIPVCMMEVEHLQHNLESVQKDRIFSVE